MGHDSLSQVARRARHARLRWQPLALLLVLLAAAWTPRSPSAGQEGNALPRNQAVAQVNTYTEDFSAYTYKAYTEEADWNIFDRQLTLLPMAGGIYSEPAIADDGRGGAYVIWKDLRNNNADGNWDVYAQRVDGRGNRLWRADLRVSPSTILAYDSVPAVVADSQGNAIVVWADGRDTPFAIYAQKLAPTGERLWANDVRVNGAPAYRVDWAPLDSLAIAMDGQDRVVVVWEGSADNNWGDPDVYAQQLGADGRRLWAQDVRVNSDTGHPQRVMAVGANAQGAIVVAWVDTRSGGEDIYAQRLSATGQRAWPAEIKVSAGTGVSQQGNPSVAVDAQGNGVIIWRNGPADPPVDQNAGVIYAQKISPQGALLWTGNVRVNRDTTHTFRGRPKVGWLPGDDMLVIWEDNRGGYSENDVYAQRLAPDGTPRWAADLSISPDNWWGQHLPRLSTRGSRAAITWVHWGSMYVQYLDTASQILLLPVPARVNEPDGHAKQWVADVAAFHNGELLVTWADSRRSDNDIRAQAISPEGRLAWPTSFLANDFDAVGTWRPQVAINRSDNALIVWNHERKEGVDAQLMEATGVRLWPAALRVNADFRLAAYASAVALPDGSFAVAWVGQREPDRPNWDIYLQRIGEDGQRAWEHDRRANTGAYLINQVEVDARNRPALAVDAQGHLVVVWRGDTGGQADLYVRRFSADGIPDWDHELPLNAHLDARRTGGDVLSTVVADDQITVAWVASTAGQTGIYAQRLGLDGRTLWGPRWVSADVAQVVYRSPDMARGPTGEIAVIWEDERQGHNLYAQLLRRDGKLGWAQPVQLNDPAVWPVEPAVATANDGSFMAVWHDGRYGDENLYAQRFNASGARLWADDLDLQPPGSEHYLYLTGVAQSDKVNAASEPITQVAFTTQQSLNGGSIAYFLSNDGGSTWEAASPGELHTFQAAGADLRWRAVLHASSDGRTSPEVTKLVLRYGPDVGGDAYEPDDACNLAQRIETDGTAQTRNFHRQADADWVTFPAAAGQTYLIEGQTPEDSSADVIAELYDRCTGLPLSSQDFAFSLGFRLEYRATANRTLYLKLLNHNPSDYGLQASYRLSVRTISAEPSPGALIIVAGRLRTHDSVQGNIDAVSDRILSLFREHSYTDDRIYYLATELGRDGVDALPSVANLQAAITTWAPALVGPDRPFTLFLVDHGGDDRFYLDKPRNEWLAPQQLDGWLAYLQSVAPGVKVNVIIESCRSGSFIQRPGSLSAPGRVVITSASAWSDAWASEQGATFSDQFLTTLSQDASLLASFQVAQEAARTAHPSQVAWLDDNADGVPNAASDGQEAAQRGFAYAGTLPDEREQWPPLIAETIGPATITGGRGLLQARVLDDEGVRQVMAIVYPPSYRPPQPGDEWARDTAPTFVLRNQGNNWYASDITGLTESGAYRVVIYAEDDMGLTARPVTISIGTVERGVYLPLVVR